MVMIMMKMYKIDTINQDKEYTYKVKFSKSLKHIQALKGMMPDIDEFHRSDMDSCLNDIEEILNNFYAGDELPYNAICELLIKVAGHLSKFLSASGYQGLLKKITHTIECFLKAKKLNAEWYETLLKWIKIQSHVFAKQNSSGNPILNAVRFDLEEEDKEEAPKEPVMTVTKSESPEKDFEGNTLQKYKEFYNKSVILGEKMNYIPSIISPVYLGIKRIIIQEKAKAIDKKFNEDGTFLTRKSYKDYFC